jgi:putative Mn2+ efflux pump MntP
MDTIKLPKPAIIDPTPETKALVTDKEAVVSPTTTAEEDRHTASQRSINRTWEITQSVLALSFILTAEIVIGFVIWGISELRSAAFTFLTTIVGTVIGFYFGRTNHQRVGGVDIGR